MKLRHLLENEDLGVHVPRQITTKELELVKNVQELASVIHDAVGATHDGESIKKLYDKLKSFSEFEFLDNVLNGLREILDANHKMSGAQEYRKQNLDKIKANTESLKKAIMSLDRSGSKKHHEELSAMIDVLDGHIDLPKKSASELKRHFIAEPSIFGTMALLDNLEIGYYKKATELDTTKPLYTLVDFPFSKLKGKYDELHYIMYFMMQLTDSPEPRKFKSDRDFRLFNKVANAGNESFEELKKLADAYLHSNQKSLIPRILELIKEVPKIQEANDRRKEKITRVYRGVGFGEDQHYGESEVIAQDRKSKFVATSTSERAAKNFALQKGHLDKDRRSSYGYMVTYKVGPEAILLDTTVLDTVYGESEILIDATKAEVIEVEEV